MARLTDSNEVAKLVDILKPKDCGIELVRIGGANDGGYLLPDDLEGIEYCFSPGVDKIASFESDLLNRGVRSFLADYSVDAAPVVLDGCTFTKKFIGSVNNDEMMTMDDWMTNSLPEDYHGDLILQMDIEGAEYEVILNMSEEAMKRFRIIVLEFHNIESLRDKNYFNIVYAAMRKINKNFISSHVHPNNIIGYENINGVKLPRVFEVTFIRKDRVKTLSDVIRLPHELDQPNIPGKKDIFMPPNWF